MSIGRLETTINGNYDNIDTQCARLSMWSNLFASPVTYITMMSLCSPKYLNDALIQLKPTELNWTSISTLMPCRAVPCRAHFNVSSLAKSNERMTGDDAQCLMLNASFYEFNSNSSKKTILGKPSKTNQPTNWLETIGFDLLDNNLV